MAAAASSAGATPASAPTSPPNWPRRGYGARELALLWGGNFLARHAPGREECRVMRNGDAARRHGGRRRSARAPGRSARASASPSRGGGGDAAGHRARHDADRHRRDVRRRRCRAVVGQAIAGQRERVFVVSKVYPHNASRSGAPAACGRSLGRLRHRPSRPLSAALARRHPAGRDGRRLRGVCGAEGKIRHWGVSNFDADDMAELLAVPDGTNCAANQVLYNPEHRGIEFDLLRLAGGARHADHGLFAGRPGRTAVAPPGARRRWRRATGRRRRRWRSPGRCAMAASSAIPKSGDAAHVRENAAAGALLLTAADLADIDRAWPPPKRRQSLAML